MNFIFAVFNLLISLCFNVHNSQPCKSDGAAEILCTFNRDLQVVYFTMPFVLRDLLTFVNIVLTKRGPIP